MSGEKTKLVPKLRFTEFQNAGRWQVGCIADIGTVLQGYGFPEKHQGLKNGDYPFYKVSDISKSLAAGNVFIEEAANYINQSLLKEMRAKPIPEGTTVFAKIGEAIRSNKRAITTAPCLIDNNVAGVKCIEGKATDFFIYLVTEQISLIEHAGGVVPAVNKSAIEAITVKFPTIAEQQKIADCLGSLDELIAAQARKVDALKTHKKGLMQQLFPREGETQPRLRFPEFQNTGEWVDVALGDIAEIKLGKMLDKQKHTTGHLLPYLNNLAVRWNNVDTSDLPKMYFNDRELERFGLRAGDVVVCEGGEPGRAAVWDGHMSDLKFQKAIHRVRFNVPFEPKILVLHLENLAGTTAFEMLFTGGGIKHLTGETFSRLKVPLIPYLEQQRIADCLTSLDALITAATQELATLKTHKKGLMQQLFPSTKALVA